MSTERCALLLRAVNVGGNNRVPMADLRALLSARAEFGTVTSYIASGNVICDAPADRAQTCAAVRALIHDSFGVDTPVILRTHDELVQAIAENPFPDAASDKMLHVMFLDGEPREGGIDALAERRQPGERIALRGADLWIDYAAGVHTSRLTRAVFDRALGVAGTARNLRTVQKLAELTAR